MPRGASTGDAEATQLLLFEPPVPPGQRATVTSPEALTADSTLDVARWWYKAHLESQGRLRNTVAAYTNDLAVLQAQVASKPLRLISSADVKGFLDAAHRKSTRKRRLTSLREFFDFLIRERKLLDVDPTDQFFPERINLKTPVPLFKEQRERLLSAASEDGPRSYVMVYFMLELGITRTELLNLRRQHVDLSDPSHPVVYVTYDDPRWRHKERRLQGDSRLTETYARWAAELPDDRLFPVLPQAVNAMLHRLEREAGLGRPVTPQTLRDTFAVEQARAGRTEDELLAILGLADDPRNRDSVRRYIKLAEPPAEVINEPSA